MRFPTTRHLHLISGTAGVGGYTSSNHTYQKRSRTESKHTSSSLKKNTDTSTFFRVKEFLILRCIENFKGYKFNTSHSPLNIDCLTHVGQTRSSLCKCHIYILERRQQSYVSSTKFPRFFDNTFLTRYDV